MINRYVAAKFTKGDPNIQKIAIIGSRTYENKNKIRESIFKLKQMFGDKLEIVSGGAQHGADKYAKKYSLELGVKYVEFNPSHTVKNLYSAMPDSYYGKEYHVSQFFHRNELIARYCDRMLAFIDSNSKSTGSQHAIQMANKYKKPIVIINEKAF